jgi:hypothetical protein
MDLSELERISKALEKSLDFWGLLLLAATAFVVIGLVVEYWHDVKEFWIIVHWPMAAFPWDKFKTLIGGILVTIGVAGELFVTYRASRVETDLRNNSHKIEALLRQQAGDAAASAKIAHDEADAVKGIADAAKKDAEDALAKGQAALRSLAQAESDAAKAQTAAANALETASKAKKVADEARQEVTEAIEKLKQVKSGRSILHSDRVVAALKQFSGTSYMFSGVGADEDSLNLVKQIDDVLRRAGWKRQPAHGRYPAINVFEPSNADQSVSVALTSGVTVSVDSPEGLTTLQTKAIADLPKHIRAAISLNLNVGSNLYPPQENGKAVDVVKGESTTLRLTIGHKP